MKKNGLLQQFTALEPLKNMKSELTHFEVTQVKTYARTDLNHLHRVLAQYAHQLHLHASGDPSARCEPQPDKPVFVREYVAHQLVARVSCTLAPRFP